MTKSEKPVAVYGAIASNLIIAVFKFIVASITGSSAMLSEGIHSTADTGNELLLLGIFPGHQLDSHYFDAIASIAHAHDDAIRPQ